MRVAAPQTGFDSWSVEGHGPRIEYAVQVLEDICAEAVDGLQRFRHGGAEVGGVLFGSSDGETVRILAARPLNCEYAFGPRFVLSERDRSNLRELLYAVQSDPELEGMEAVGWYHSHTRTGIELSPRDMEIYDSYFPQRRQVALVLRPDHFGPARAGFFFRERDKTVHTAASYCEFDIQARRAPRKGRGEEVETAVSEPASPEPAPQPEAGWVLDEKAPVVAADRAENPGRKWAWLLVLTALVAATALGVERYYRLAAPPQPLSLWVADMGGQLLIEWDRTAQPIRDAEGATLEITDGKDRADIRIEGDRLREGSVDYVRRAEIVDVRLRLKYRGRPMEEFIRFVGQPVQRAGSSQEAEMARQNEALKAEVATLRAQLETTRPAPPRPVKTATVGRPVNR